MKMGSKSGSKSMKHHWKWGLGPSRVLPGEARGPVWLQGGPGLEKGTIPPRKSRPFLTPKWRPGSTFRGSFLGVFWGARVAVFLWFWVPEDRILASILALLWELWAFGKTAESVVMVVNFRGLAPARLSSFTGPDCGCVSVTFFSSFLWFLVVWELPFWELLGLIAVKKGIWKKNTKKELKEECGPCKENRPLGCGPLKEQENKTSEHQKPRKPKRWIKHALTYLKARWRIYIYIKLLIPNGTHRRCSNK